MILLRFFLSQSLLVVLWGLQITRGWVYQAEHLVWFEHLRVDAFELGRCLQVGEHFVPDHLCHLNLLAWCQWTFFQAGQSLVNLDLSAILFIDAIFTGSLFENKCHLFTQLFLSCLLFVGRIIVLRCHWINNGVCFSRKIEPHWPAATLIRFLAVLLTLVGIRGVRTHIVISWTTNPCRGCSNYALRLWLQTQLSTFYHECLLGAIGWILLPGEQDLFLRKCATHACLATQAFEIRWSRV